MIIWRRLVSFLVALLLLLALVLPPAALGFPGAAFAVSPPLSPPVSSPSSGSPGPEAEVPQAEVIDGGVLQVSVLDAGSSLFGAHCAGCHLQGGNIIRRGKTLKLAALERNGVASPDAIAAIAAGGIGQMGGYAQSLGEGGPEAVAAWVWQQALDGWPRA
ncbi:c-type cytochrome [Cyanobium sp. Lug-B]|uniref:c-type cytochrome n=1 Tax=Cyanobium sp. Lug-B TaxID=2823716 RepID=UPI0028F3EEFA|nr:c-type cytochrome [Cyanobium sp. Lug-B]